jgi:type IV secretory pathway VirB6-like protein
VQSENIFYNNKYFAFFIKACFCLFLIFTINSCSDQGCIEADDFGEYESETIEVPSNSLQESCFFDHSKSLTDSSQGSGIKDCLTSGTHTVGDEEDITQTSANNDGCIGFTDATFQNLCINYCIDLCNTSSSTSSGSAEPEWTSTNRKIPGRNIGVTIRPGAQISIRAIGNVVLGSTLRFPDAFIQANNEIPHSKDVSWQDTFFDARRNQSLFIKFSGAWNDGADPLGQTSATVGAGTATINNTQADARIYNGAKRAILYSISHPDGYDFNPSLNDEMQGSIGVPLLPDARAWNCEYSNSGNSLESNCANSPSGYTSAGYVNVNDSLANTIFPVSSTYKLAQLSQYGGIIRWNNDELLPESYDPFAISGVICNGTTGSCNNINSVNANEGRVIGSQLENSDVEIANNQTSAYRVSFKSLSGDANCNTSFSSLSIKNQNGDTLNTINNFAVNNTNWSPQDITLEANQRLVIAQNPLQHPGGISCGALIGVRFHKYHDINIIQSGFVKFTMLRGSGNCNIRGRIINPNGNHVDVDTSYTADFYEYDNFLAAASNDPLNSISVSASPPLGQLQWSDSFFARKGQILRFAPQSWNGNWLANNSLNRQCGIGMAMHIEPRPALLCRGSAPELVDNPNCTALFEGANIIGCQDLAQECTQSASASYCPSTDCQAPVTCTGTGDVSNNFTRTGCSLGAVNPTCIYGSGYNISTCQSCNNLRLTNASSSAKTEVDNIDQCYDLENYLGKVANIPGTNGLTREQVDDFLNDGTKSKGAIRLQTFNGQYGNLSNFTNSSETDSVNNNAIYQLKTPVTFINSGRVRFFMLDGNNFNGAGSFDAYSNNSANGVSYSGVNGFKINITGTLEYNNGTWMQARLCQEADNSSYICSNMNPVPVPSQPSLVEITAPTQVTPPGSPPNLSGHYRFNDYGNLIRTAPLNTNPTSGDCTATVTGIENFSGANFYCHTHQYASESQLENMSELDKEARNNGISRLRLTFKILDPEIGNCNITPASSNDGIISDNPYYDPSVAGNAGQTCQPSETPGAATTPPTPNLCQKEFFCANKYANNHGKYNVSIRVKNPTDGQISNIIGEVINPIVEIMDGKKDNPATANVDESTIGQAERVYKLLISDSRYQAILNIALVTMFTFYGFGYLIGVVEMKQDDLIMRIVKIGLIYLFVSETGWEWFDKIVVKLFKNSTDYLAFMMASSFDDSPELRNAISDGEFYDKSILFGSVDKVFELFFASAVQKKISALLFASIFGWAYLFIIYSSFMLYVYAVSNAVLLYLTAQVFISILFVLGPIFFIFTLFNQTKEMFDNWLKQLIGFSLQQIFLLTTLAFFNMLMYEVIKMSLGYKICWDEVWTINIYITRITLLSFWTIASLPPRTNQHSEIANIGNPEGIPSLFTILFIWVIASLMHKFISFMTDLAAGIAGGLKASALGSGVSAMAAQMRKSAGGALGKVSEAIGPKAAARRLDKALFDSGKLAEEARGKQRKQNSMDQNNKSAMQKAGDKAMSDYKRDNAKELMKMTQDEQRAKLKDVRDKGMNAEGKKLGLSDTDIERLKTSKGSTYVGSNMIGYGANRIRQKFSSGGTLNKTLEDRDINTTLSHSEGQDALKKMSADERKDFIKAAQEGKVSVDSSKLNKLRNNKLRAAGAVVTGGLSEGALAAGSNIKNWNENRKLRNKAAAELENSGIINRMRGGIGRSDEDKKLINERFKQMKESSTKDKAANHNSIAELQRESDYIDKKAEIASSDDNIASKGLSYAGQGLKRMFRADNLNNEKKQPTKQKTKEKLQADIQNRASAAEALEISRDRAFEEYEEAMEPVREDVDRIEELEKMPKLEKDQKQELKERKAKVAAHKSTEAVKNAAAAYNQYDSEIGMLEEQQEDLAQDLASLEKPGMWQRAKSALFKKKNPDESDA